MFKTIAIIILSVTFFGVLFFILVRNALRRKLDILVEEEKKRKSAKQTEVTDVNVDANKGRNGTFRC